MQYVVQAGDSLYTIAQKFGTSVEAIIQANNFTNPNLIYVGQVLIIPVVTAPTPSPPSPAPIEICPELSRGSSGASVTRLQNLLLSKGINPGVVDGIFGSNTEAAVRTFQSQYGLSVTGIVGISTWTALGVNCGITPVPPTPAPLPQYFCPVLRLGDRGAAVRFLQTLLRDKGFYGGKIDGVYGRTTQLAVRQFQREMGITVTGVVNRTTWEALGVECIREPVPPSGTPIATKVGRGIRHILYTNKRIYYRGEDVKISLVKTNISDDEINLRYKTSQIIEITVDNASGRTVWWYSQEKNFAQFTRLITIFPGGTQVINETWDQQNNNGRQVGPGTYTITVTNLATDVSLSVKIEIR